MITKKPSPGNHNYKAGFTFRQKASKELLSKVEGLYKTHATLEILDEKYAPPWTDLNPK
ncbi:MAG: hypothetical protein ACI8Y7_000667 [Candidatus Woesearchaeota archaeon]